LKEQMGRAIRLEPKARVTLGRPTGLRDELFQILDPGSGQGRELGHGSFHPDEVCIILN
jgi:hypothetical protein